MTDRDYVLGTHDAEIDRLGLQHSVWRPYALDAWRRAGVTVGQHVIDFGAGPGFASADLAGIVGVTGEVIALERSQRFIEAIRARCPAQVSPVEIDLSTTPLPVIDADAAWARWIFAFLPDPQAALVRLAEALKPGGVLVLHEYLDYGTWRLSPRSASFERFVGAVMQSWRDAGGEPDVGLDLPRWMEAAGFRIEAQRCVTEVLRPSDFMWAWPTSFLEVNIARLQEIGQLTEAEADAARADFVRIAALPGVRMVTPVVAEIIGRKI